MTMELHVSSLMTTPVTTVRADDNIGTVADTLRLHDLSFVPVVDKPNGAVLGIISASDILHFQAAGRELQSVLAWQICAYNPIAVEPDALAVDVARLMLQHQVHHVVVMKDRELVGIVSSLDFVRLFVSREQGAA